MEEPGMQATSQEQISQHYRRWRSRLLISMIIGYAAFYLTRKSFNFVMPVMQLELGLDKGHIGWITTLFYLAYGSSKFISGVFHDRTGYRWFMGAGLVMTGVLNIIFAFCSSFSALLIIWTLNGFFQGWGWPPCARLLTHWYSRNERGFWWGYWNISINIVGITVPMLSAFLATTYSWQTALMMPGIIGILLGIWLCYQLCGTPQQHGLPSVGQWRQDSLELRHEQLSHPMPMMQILRDTILTNRTIWLLGCSYILVYLIRMAINDWGNLWLSETHGANLLSANATLSLFELGGLTGALFSGWGSDLLFRGQRAPMILLFALGLFMAVTALWLTPIHHYTLLAVCFFSIGFFVFGPQMLIGLAATEYCHKQAAGTVTGYLGLYAYLGAAIAGWPLSQVVAHYGWSGMFALLTAAAAMMGLLLMPMLMADVSKREHGVASRLSNNKQF
ncbi:MFS transporter [Photorhabdus laumondii subsp. laumondii]|nr:MULTISPECIES: MFS transporter family glucose-6-phosphate receptor UhpC [Photorhabdus]AXG41566.1 MFS transporter family glucose-6-phosphate receptor UhpC [Photorhabdus laumondii subsp. laumondii]AXG46092.1 MFS transporter family glucose-6-phosphate receptor UhpC [Photorhabdus laumondii subsp. laumondii]MCC8383322.1 MFS transporter family glucose-6-phosphate receptor UhpC [Photorhabdus laumondii]MCC8387289.1 MFS transporter family glucose-6-phosphate receptor UhpC [Photorhabdus laumondii]MCC8